ncbi:MAG: argininosuccinate lyase [Candidatus Kapabacteria bacterium]|nr:argininosuccinate lyase [Candidatus Kapabacteria bacterium]
MLWGGRFKDKLNDNAMEFSSSLSFDINLIGEDIKVSIAHAEMLAFVNIISEDESIKIVNGLNSILKLYNNNEWKPEEFEFEDVHSAVEAKLFELIGEIAGKLHTGRSRNDQIATGFRLWTKKAISNLIEEISNFQKALINLSELHTETIMPGYTHMQRAQPISFAFHLLAYIEMLERDKNRLKFVFEETNISPLGCGALAGSTLPLDRNLTSEKLNFSKPASNALDAISDRDFVLDFLNSCNIGMMHISRLSEELIIWSTSEFNFIKLGDSFTTGSSLMPQKKNPDMAELSRGKTGRVYGNYTAVSTMMKGLPLSYNRDMQEDKEPVFDSFNNYYQALSMMIGMISTITVNKNRFVNELEGDFIFSTELAEWLVVKGIPFRESHHIVGEVVKLAEENHSKLHQLSLEQLQKINPIFDETAIEVFKVEGALYRKKTFGSPNPNFVKDEINRWKLLLSVED